ncbi:hypothetical protein MRB53_038781 [Persea americana]|nr:hypothetical protein MRB53_038781 [Persea americana]
MAPDILLADDGREEEERVVERVGGQADQVGDGEVDDEARCGFAAVVEDGPKMIEDAGSDAQTSLLRLPNDANMACYAVRPIPLRSHHTLLNHR